jgi:hypothetical protein
VFRSLSAPALGPLLSKLLFTTPQRLAGFVVFGFSCQTAHGPGGKFSGRGVEAVRVAGQ